MTEPIVGTIKIEVDYGPIKLDFTYQPTKDDVVATFAYMNARIEANNQDDPNSAIIAGLSDQLKQTNDEVEGALKTANKTKEK